MNKKSINIPNAVKESDAYKAGQVLGYNVVNYSEINQQYQILSSESNAGKIYDTNTEALNHGFID